MLKRRFSALLYANRTKVDINQAVVTSAIMLHNFLSDLKEPFPVLEAIDDAEFQDKLQRQNMQDAIT